MSKLEEIKAGVAYVGALLSDMHTRSADEPFDEATQRAWDEGKAYVEEHKQIIEDAKSRDEFKQGLEALMGTGSELRQDKPGASVNFNKGDLVDVFDHNTLTYERGKQLEDRAKRVIGDHLPEGVSAEKREAMEDRATRAWTRNYHTDEIQRHIVRTSSPEYIRAFKDYCENPRDGRARILSESEARAAMSLTAANGGVLVPQFLDPTIVLTNAGSYNDVRRISKVVQITVDQWDGVTSAGVSAAWLAEGAAAADASPTFVAPTIPVFKAAAWLFGSYEMIADSGFDAVGELVADAKDRIESTAFASGNGTTQPNGLFRVLSGTGPAVTGTSSTAGVAGTYQLHANDPYQLTGALSPRFLKEASFLTTNSTINELRRQTDTRENYWQDYGAGVPPTLLGYPVYRNEDGHKSVTSGASALDPVMILGDFSRGYYIIDRVGLEIMYEPMIFSGGSMTPTGQGGWFAFWRTGADVITSNAFKTLVL